MEDDALPGQTRFSQSGWCGTTLLVVQGAGASRTVPLTATLDTQGACGGLCCGRARRVVQLRDVTSWSLRPHSRQLLLQLRAGASTAVETLLARSDGDRAAEALGLAIEEAHAAAAAVAGVSAPSARKEDAEDAPLVSLVESFPSNACGAYRYDHLQVGLPFPGGLGGGALRTTRSKQVSLCLRCGPGRDATQGSRLDQVRWISSVAPGGGCCSVVSSPTEVGGRSTKEYVVLGVADGATLAVAVARGAAEGIVNALRVRLRQQAFAGKAGFSAVALEPETLKREFATTSTCACCGPSGQLQVTSHNVVARRTACPAKCCGCCQSEETVVMPLTEVAVVSAADECSCSCARACDASSLVTRNACHVARSVAELNCEALSCSLCLEGVLTALWEALLVVLALALPGWRSSSYLVFSGKGGRGDLRLRVRPALDAEGATSAQLARELSAQVAALRLEREQEEATARGVLHGRAKGGGGSAISGARVGAAAAPRGASAASAVRAPGAAVSVPAPSPRPGGNGGANDEALAAEPGPPAVAVVVLCSDEASGAGSAKADGGARPLSQSRARSPGSAGNPFREPGEPTTVPSTAATIVRPLLAVVASAAPPTEATTQAEAEAKAEVGAGAGAEVGAGAEAGAEAGAGAGAGVGAGAARRTACSMACTWLSVMSRKGRYVMTSASSSSAPSTLTRRCTQDDSAWPAVKMMASNNLMTMDSASTRPSETAVGCSFRSG